MTVAHVGGLPLEETIAAGGPALLAALGALGAQLRVRRNPRRSATRRPGRGTAERAHHGSPALMSDRPRLTPPNDTRGPLPADTAFVSNSMRSTESTSV